MTPNEKARELIDKYRIILIQSDTDVGEEILCTGIAKQSALIAVDEILNSNPRYPNNVDWDDAGGSHAYYYEAQFEESEKYWDEVKQEIEKL